MTDFPMSARASRGSMMNRGRCVFVCVHACVVMLVLWREWMALLFVWGNSWNIGVSEAEAWRVRFLLSAMQSYSSSPPLNAQAIPSPIRASNPPPCTSNQQLVHLTPNQQLVNLSPNQQLVHLTPNQQLVHLTPYQQLVNLTPNQQLGKFTTTQEISKKVNAFFLFIETCL